MFSTATCRLNLILPAVRSAMTLIQRQAYLEPQTNAIFTLSDLKWILPVMFGGGPAPTSLVVQGVP